LVERSVNATLFPAVGPVVEAEKSTTGGDGAGGVGSGPVIPAKITEPIKLELSMCITENF
jgi:hypothetical protein